MRISYWGGAPLLETRVVSCVHPLFSVERTAIFYMISNMNWLLAAINPPPNDNVFSQTLPHHEHGKASVQNNGLTAVLPNSLRRCKHMWV